MTFYYKNYKFLRAVWILLCVLVLFILGFNSKFLWGIVAVVLMIVLFYLVKKTMLEKILSRLSDAKDKLFDECLCSPVFKEAEEQLSYIRYMKMYRNLLYSEKALAMICNDRAEDARAMLSDIDISECPKSEKKSAIRPMAMLSYYCNLSLACACCNDGKTALDLITVCRDAVPSIPNPSLRENTTVILDVNETAALISEKKYDEVISKLDVLSNILSNKKHNKFREVQIAYIYALAYIGKGERVKAKEKLEFVIENGGKLCWKEKSEELIKTL